MSWFFRRLCTSVGLSVGPLVFPSILMRGEGDCACPHVTLGSLFYVLCLIAYHTGSHCHIVLIQILLKFIGYKSIYDLNFFIPWLLTPTHYAKFTKKCKTCKRARQSRIIIWCLYDSIFVDKLKELITCTFSALTVYSKGVCLAYYKTNLNKVINISLRHKVSNS